MRRNVLVKVSVKAEGAAGDQGDGVEVAGNGSSPGEEVSIKANDETEVLSRVGKGKERRGGEDRGNQRGKVRNRDREEVDENTLGEREVEGREGAEGDKDVEDAGELPA